MESFGYSNPWGEEQDDVEDGSGGAPGGGGGGGGVTPEEVAAELNRLAAEVGPSPLVGKDPLTD